MVLHLCSTFTDSFLSVPKFLHCFVMDALEIDEVCAMDIFVFKYFKKDEMIDRSAKNFICFASFFDSSREFIPDIYKQYQALNTFSGRGIG